ncbi:MAG: segregation/condensation protein A [Lentisphaerae bacterium]|jgi:segregation and condensation protein A|nr:segregation/condensation protein A [Lentisphaerota bacterium]
MSGSSTPTEYKVDLDVFEGPLDLLLYLIRRDEIDIYDISIEHITKQYLEYLDMMRMLDLNIAGEFLVMAATLMLIKSRMLLPVESRADDDDTPEEGVDPRLDLVRQLIEYKKFKDAAAQLMAREALQAERFVYGGAVAHADDMDGEPEAPPLGDVGLFDLLAAFQEVLARAPIEPLGHLEPIRWSVPDKMESILGAVKRRETVAFSRLFRPESHRGEVIITFLALLELLRLRQVAIRQHAPFTEIIISKIPDNLPVEALAPPVIGGGSNVPT